MTVDVVAERQLLAMALSGHPSVGERFVALPAGAFTDPTHGIVATVLRDRIIRGIPVDPLTVAGDAASLAGTDHQAGQVRQFVTVAAGTAPPLSSWDYYADLVVTYAAARSARASALRLAQQLDGPMEADQLAAVDRKSVV